MKPITLDRSHILIGVMLFLCVAAIVSMTLVFRADEVTRAVSSKNVLNILMIVENEKRPAVTALFMVHPATGRSAILDIPSETGLILESLKRVDRIESAYDPSKPAVYVSEISKFVGAQIDAWMVFDAQSFVRMVDLMEGLELFIPNPVDSPGDPAILLPGGAVVLDGDKAFQYARYSDGTREADTDAVVRRQRLFQSIIRRIAQKSDILRRRDVFSTYSSSIRTNFSRQALLRFIAEAGKIDADRIVLQKITGSYRSVDSTTMLFPHYDGELVRDIVRQTINALVQSGTSSARIYTVEILNGSEAKGMARSASEIYQSFGYNVVAVNNADRSDYEKTVIIDRFGDPAVAKAVGSVIRCENLSPKALDSKVVADYTIILGSDFNGRYCAR